MRPVTIKMSCLNGGKQTNTTSGISIAILERFCNYTISSILDSQVIFIRALELTNAKLTDTHTNSKLQKLRFLNASIPDEKKPLTYDIMTPKTHQLMSLVNLTLPLLIITTAILLVTLLICLGKKVLHTNLYQHVKIIFLSSGGSLNSSNKPAYRVTIDKQRNQSGVTSDPQPLVYNRENIYNQNI